MSPDAELPSRRWAVVGGGLLGMALARGLREAGHDVDLYEAREGLGGLADAWSLGDARWDRHYHVLLESDLSTIGLIRELDLGDHIQWQRTRTGFFSDGRLHSMSNALEFLLFPPLDLVSKVRLALTILVCSRIRDGRSLEKVPVSEWLTRWSGRRAFETMWKPLLQAKLGAQYEHASASFIWAIIRRMYSARRQGAKTERLGYLREGYGVVQERLGEDLRARGVRVALGTRVTKVERTDTGQRVLLGDGTKLDYDRVVLTLPAPWVARICSDLGADERRRLEAIRYQGVVCESYLLRQPLSPYYVTNITDAWVPFTGVIEMTALVPKETFAGRSLVYLPRYVPPDDPLFECSDEELRGESLDALERMYPHFDRSQVEAHRVSRARHVLAISTLDYSASMPPVRTSSPGLFSVGAAHINNGTLNVDETLQLAARTLPELLDSTDAEARHRSGQAPLGLAS